MKAVLLSLTHYIMNQPRIYSMPEEFMYDQNVPAHWRVLGILNGFFLNRKKVYASNKWFSEQLGCSERTITEAIGTLERIGKISCKRTKTTRVITDVKDSDELLPPSQSTAIPLDSNELLSNADLNADNILGGTEVPQGKCSLPIEVVPDTEKPKVIHKVKHPAYQVFQIFRDVTGYFPDYWSRNKTIRESADSLWKTKGPDQIRRALLYYMDNKSVPYCPEIITPFDLETKWKKLSIFKEKNGN